MFEIIFELVIILFNILLVWFEILLWLCWCYMFSIIVVEKFRICFNNVIVIYVLNLGGVYIKYFELNKYNN